MKKLVSLVGIFTFSASVLAQTFTWSPPKFSDDRRVDACMHYTNGANGCDEFGTRAVAAKYCSLNGYYLESYETVWEQPVFLVKKLVNNSYWEDKVGGHIFTKIVCKN